MKISTKAWLAAAIIGTAGMTACETQQRSRAPRTTQATSGDTVMQPNARRSGSGGMATTTTTTTAPAEGRRVSRGGWPTMASGGGMGWGSMAYPTGSASTSAVGVEVGTPMEVRANQPFDAMVVVTNLTDQALQDVTVTEQLGTNYSLRSASLRGRQNADGTVSWTIDELAPRESKTIRMTGVATSGPVSNCVSVAYASQLCSVVNVVEPQLKITKSSPSGSDVLACDDIVYNFVVTNSGTGTIENVKITDPLPNGLTTAGGARNITFDVGNLAAGQSREFSSTVRASAAGRYENRARATGDGGMSAESGTVTTMVHKPVLTIAKNCPAQGFIGRPLRYEITVRNTGDGEARNVVLEDIIPAGATVVQASDGGRSGAGKVTWNLGTLAPDQARTVTLQVQTEGAGTLVNRATAQAFCADMVSDSCSTELKGIPAILLEVIDIEDPDLVGTTEDYHITVTNQGSAPATNIRIVCTLEPEHEYVSSAGPSTGSLRGPRTVEFAPLASLAPKAKATWVVTTRSLAPGDIRFKVSMTSDILTRPVEETEATRFYQ